MNNTSSSSGIGFVGLLTILFIGLKLTGCIGWSWWIVLSPVLIIAAIIIAVLAVWLIIILIADRRKEKR